MDPVKACKAILDGMTLAIKKLKPNSLTLIRIVILQQPVFQAFRSEISLATQQQVIEEEDTVSLFFYSTWECLSS